MGGKTKQSQRTKNNARPSSSGRSAELLQSTVSPTPGLIFGVLQSTPLLFPTLSTPTLDQGLSQEYAICIKRLNKKDPITKVKALHELNDLVSNGNVDDVLLVLPSWEHFYRLLAADTDCKVRESAQACHGAFARVCGRRLAPALRRLLPAWLAALHDEHAPAAALARASLQATFPENKLPEVINFCKEEIMSQILDNIVGKSEKSLPKKSEDPEELAQQLQRLAVGSLQGLRMMAERLPGAQLEWMLTSLEPLLASSAFWKMPTHSSSRIRDAWFSTAAQLVQRLGDKLPPSAGRRILLAAAKDSLAQRHSWRCLLHLIHAVPDWHKWLDKGDVINKRILDLLEKGGWGDSRQLNDVLLPLLANLPQEHLTKDFYEKLFTAFLNGLQKKSILNSKTEQRYWITNMSECLNNLSVQTYDFVVEVVTSVHRNWLKTILSNKNDQLLMANLIKHSASCMTSLIKFWLKQCKEGNGGKYDQLLRNFWQNIGSTVLSQLETIETDALSQVVEGHILLLQMLRREFSGKPKKVKSIKFEDATIAEDTKLQVETPEGPEIDDVSAKRFEHNLSNVVESICGDYVQYADKNSVSEPILASLLVVLNEFESRDLYLALGRHFDVHELYGVYHNVLFQWLLDTNMECESLVEIVFLLLKYLTTEEQQAVLASFDKLGLPALQRCVRRAALPATGGAVTGWLSSAAAQRVLLHDAKAALQSRSGHILPPVLADREELIGSETAGRILEAVTEALAGCVRLVAECERADELAEPALLAAERTVLQAARLARGLAAALGGPACPLYPLYRGLVVHLFDFAMHHPGLCVSESEWWRETCAVLPRVGPAALAPRLEAALTRRPDTVDIGQVEHMGRLWPHLWEGFLLGQPPADLRPLAALCLLAAQCAPRDRAVDVFALRYDLIAGSLSCPFEDSAAARDADSGRPHELAQDIVVRFLTGHVFRAALLRTVLLHRTTDDMQENQNTDDDRAQDDLQQEKKENEWCQVLLGDRYFQTELCELLREHVVLRSLDKGYGFWDHHELIRECRLEAERALRDIVRQTPGQRQDEVLAALTTKAASEGYYWPYAARLYEEAAGRTQRVADVADALLDNTITGNGFFHSLQAAEGGPPESRPADDKPSDEGQEDAEDKSGERRLRALQLVAARAVAAAWPAGRAVADAAASPANPSLRPFADLATLHRCMLIDREIASMRWGEVVAEAAVLRFAAQYLARRGWHAEQYLWDFANVGLCAVLRNVATARQLSTKVAMLATAACELFAFVAPFVRSVPAECERREPGPHVAALPEEWREVFAPTLYAHLWKAAHDMLEYSGPELGLSWAWTLGAVGEAIRLVRWKVAEDTLLTQGVTLRGVCTAAARVLSSARPRVQQVLAYYTLVGAVPALRTLDEEQIMIFQKERDKEGDKEGDNQGDREEDKQRNKEDSQRVPELSPDWLRCDIQAALEAVHACTPGVTALQPAVGSAGHAACLGGLLLVDAAAALTDVCGGALGHYYVRWYRESGHAVRSVSLSLSLLPPSLLAPSPPASVDAAFAQYFERVEPRPATDGWWSSPGAVGALACRGVEAVMGSAGAACVRSWAGAGPGGRARPALRRLLRTHCTPRLARRLLHPLLGSSDLFPAGVTRTVEWASREAVVTLEADDEQHVSLVLTLAADHPLGPPRARCLPPPAHSQPHRAPDWVALYLAYQNGSAVRAASMWAQAVARAVDEAEPCLICYGTLRRGRLPDQRCRQCRRRYHRQCLHTWFKTSSKTQCPLCRGNF